MFRKIYPVIISLTAALLAVGCTDSSQSPDEELLVPGAPGTVTISLKNSKMSRSDESDNSETLLSDLAIGLYVGGSDDDAEPVVFKTFSDVNENVSTKVVVRLSDDEISALFGTQNTCRMYVLANISENAVEPLPSKPTVAQMKNLNIKASFKEQKVQPSFVMAGEGVVYFTPGQQGYQQGSGTGSATVYRAAAKIVLRLRIPRAIEVKDEEGNVVETWNSVTTVVGDPTTSANPIRALLNSGVCRSVAAPTIPWDPTSENAYYDSDPVIADSPRFFSKTGEETVEDVTYDIFDMQVPFYSYPNMWEETAEETHKTTITLRVPWQKEGDTKSTTMYYFVPITPVTLTHIDRNYSYTVNMTVGMLGSRTPDMPVEVDNLSYQAVNWANETLAIKIPDTRYLVVNPNVYTVNNESEIAIPYYTSHPVEISDISMTYERFNFYSNGNGDTVHIEIPKLKIDRSVVLDNDGVTPKDTIVDYSIEQDPYTKQMTLRIKHDLKIWTPVRENGATVDLTDNANNTLTTVKNNIYRYVLPDNPEDAYSPYTIRVHIAHKDDNSFKEDIVITQYPAMYINPIRNTGGGNTRYNNVTATGNVIVNAGYVGTYNYSWGTYTYPLIGSMANELSGNNANPNMYVITVSQLSVGSDYTIGDPRSPYCNNNLSGDGALVTPTQDGNAAGAYTGNFDDYQNNATGNNWCRKAPALYPNTDQRTLTYYYPTIEDQVAYEKMVAPKFRVASSYGKTYRVNRQGARRRMATYQEVDCPAGRWRLPTYGELQYIISLSSTGKIPVLFTRGSAYWTAQGACTVNNNGTITLTTETSAFVRGVYDEWFWEEYPQYSIKPTGNNYTYTLGDMPRNPQ